MILNWEVTDLTNETNYGSRFEYQPPEFIIIHGSGLPPNATADGELAYLRRPNLKVSYHFYLRKDGRIAQLVPLNSRAFHAGKSFWREHEREWDGLNTYSFALGLESQNLDNETYPDEQIEACLGLTAYLMPRYDIPLWRVLTHRSVSYPRKIDPVNWDHDAFLRRLEGSLVEP